MKLPELKITASDRIQKEEEFFSKRFILSYSGLNKLSYCPQQFYDWYILQQREMTFGKSMIDGKLIHCKLLNPQEFDNLFVVTPAALPSPAMVSVLNIVFNRCMGLYDDILPDPTVYRTEFLEELALAPLYQSLKNDDGRMAKVADLKNVYYWIYLIESGKRDVISSEQLDEANLIVEKITSNVPFMKIMGYYQEFEVTAEKHNEIMLYSFLDNRMFDIRGILDNLVIDHTNKEIRINDLKKSGKDLLMFPSSIAYFRYDLQAAMYYTLVSRTFGAQFPDYKIVFRFMVIDNNLQIAPVRITEETMQIWLAGFETMLDECEYHFKERRFDLPYSVAINNEIVL